MSHLNSKFPALLSTFTAITLAGCGFSKWHDHFELAEKALKSNAADRLPVAEEQLKVCIETAWKDRVPEKEIVYVYAKLGDVLMEEKKYSEAPLYLLRTLQFNNALKTDEETNIAQLKKLVTAYEKARDYEQAAQTQEILVKFIECELSPMNPDYKVQSDKYDQLKRKLALFNRPVSKEAISQATAPVEKDEPVKQELLQGWH